MRILGTVASSSREVPNAPTIGTATNVGTGRAFNNGAATVTFTAPTFNGGLPILDYTVTSSPGGFTATGASSPLTVAGLASSTSYTFTVRARNAVGTGAASAASNSITATTVPQAPTIGTAADGGTGTTATVTYTAGATGGAAVSAYTATYSPGSLTGTGASPITVSGLTTGTAYTFTVRATNANGQSLASAASNSVTPVSPSSYESIATFTGNGSNTVITFSSIPGTYKHLQIRFVARTTSSAQGTLRFNGDSSTNYSAHTLWAYAGGSTTSSSDPGSFYNGIFMTSNNFTSSTNTYNAGIIDILDYTSTSKHKTVAIMQGFDINGNGGCIELHSGTFFGSTAAITSLSITGSQAFATGSNFALYGIKG
jgi:hypothetical protein